VNMMYCSSIEMSVTTIELTIFTFVQKLFDPC